MAPPTTIKKAAKTDNDAVKAATREVVENGATNGNGSRGTPAPAPGSRLAEADPFEPEAIEVALAPLLERFDVKAGRLYQPIRVAITGTTVSPGIFDSLAALGRDASCERIAAAIARLG